MFLLKQWISKKHFHPMYFHHPLIASGDGFFRQVSAISLIGIDPPTSKSYS
jgi:hypothetical protein